MSSSDCSVIQIILKNEAFFYQTSYTYGNFEESSFSVNGRKIWKNKLYGNAIWYMSNKNQKPNRWMIGEIQYIGEDFVDFYALDQYSGLIDSRNQWHYKG